MDLHGEKCYNVTNHIANGRALLPTAPTVSHDGVSVMTTPIVPTPDSTDNLKHCIVCGQLKPLDAFHVHKGARDGRRNECIDCRCQRERERGCTDEARKRRRERYANDPEYRAAQNKSNRASAVRNREKTKQRQRKWYEENRPRILEESKAYRAANADKIIRRDAAYRNSPEGHAKRMSSMYRRRAITQIVGSFTAEDIEAIRKAQGSRCYICHKRLGKKYHVDHFIPLAKGGTNDPGNLRLACPKCNLSKGAKHPFEIGQLI